MHCTSAEGRRWRPSDATLQYPLWMSQPVSRILYLLKGRALPTSKDIVNSRMLRGASQIYCETTLVRLHGRGTEQVYLQKNKCCSPDDLCPEDNMCRPDHSDPRSHLCQELLVSG